MSASGSDNDPAQRQAAEGTRPARACAGEPWRRPSALVDRVREAARAPIDHLQGDLPAAADRWSADSGVVICGGPGETRTPR
jgi:hypothetical protein